MEIEGLMVSGPGSVDRHFRQTAPEGKEHIPGSSEGLIGSLLFWRRQSRRAGTRVAVTTLTTTPATACDGIAVSARYSSVRPAGR
jgi:hypothetical protein